MKQLCAKMLISPIAGIKIILWRYCPRRAEIEYMQFNADNTRMTDEENKAVSIINTGTPQVLRDKGYTFAAFPTKHPDNVFQLERLRQEAKTAITEMYKTAKINEDDAFKANNTLGPDLKPVRRSRQSRFAFIHRLRRLRKNLPRVAAKDIPGDVFLGILTAGASVTPNQAGLAKIALIDGTTGDILWADEVCNSA